ncbi:MAG TPA: hypothetical protein VJM33_02235 [Microthrixaceae bacterium]|nr:hypothetical protein [Microthrixaceae bacterium]
MVVRGRWWALAVVVAVACTTLSACSSSPEFAFVDATTSPLRTPESGVADLDSLDAAMVANTVQYGAQSGEEYWVGREIQTVGPGPVEVVRAVALTTPGIRDARVLIGTDTNVGAGSVRLGFGPPGATTPGPAVGTRFDGARRSVVYVVGTLEQGERHGGLIGARLTVRDDEGEHRLDLSEALLLCADPMPDLTDPLQAFEPEPCEDGQKSFARHAFAAFRDDFHAVSSELG